ncbi:P-loop containing nucleoside triphosphate hydrolase protein [Lyophyllum atratum]|nr:P-loop containing nucleoside triphosphate hydrolase protein [Lyophyllum atratum]
MLSPLESLANVTHLCPASQFRKAKLRSALLSSAFRDRPLLLPISLLPSRMGLMRKLRLGTRWLKDVKEEDVFCSDPRPTDLVVALLGPTGAGKSTFINTFFGDPLAVVGNDLESKTKNVRHFCFLHPDFPGRRIMLVDTPGFDDTYLTDGEILRRIAIWLARSYNYKMKLAGLIYLHRITDNRMSGSAMQNVEMFKKLCGKDASKKVVLVTTMWDEVSEATGAQRERQIKDKFWKDMLELGSRTVRFHLSQSAARDIVDSIIRLNDFRPVKIQEELCNMDVDFWETEAALSIFTIQAPLNSRSLPETHISSLKNPITEPKWKKVIQESDSFMKDPRTTDRVILILGSTGAGKSTFINAYIGEALASVGHGSVSHTQHVQSFSIPNPGTSFTHRLVVVDTPGFDDTYLTDQEILRRIAIWLARSYTANMKLAGVIHLVNISQSLTEKTKKYLSVCHRLCGQNASRKVILATTKWSETRQPWAEEQEQVLKRWWETLYGPGSRMVRFDNTPTCAAAIIRSALDENDHSGIQIQRELVERDKPINETEAALSLPAGGRGVLKPLAPRTDQRPSGVGSAIGKIFNRQAPDIDVRRRE